MASARARRFPNLEALRGVAAMSVLFAHISHFTPFPSGGMASIMHYTFAFAGHGGRLGVLFFFLLSGFLITYRLLTDRAVHGRIRIGRFYLRRALRIWPLYFVTLMIGFVLYPLVAPEHLRAPIEIGSILYYLFFVPNHYYLLTGAPPAPTLGVHWSVGVEEQFYLLWPLLLALANRRTLPFILLALVAISSTYASSVQVKTAYYHLFGNLRFLAVGGLLGWFVLHHEAWVRAILERVPRLLRMAIPLLGPLLLLGLYAWAMDYPTRLQLVNTLAVIFFSLLLLDQTHASPRSFSVERVPFLNWLGDRSYGIYLLHVIAMVMVQCWTASDPRFWVVSTLLIVALSIALAHLSYLYVERPFLRWKEQSDLGAMHL